MTCARPLWPILILLSACVSTMPTSNGSDDRDPRPRARDLGIVIGSLPPGELDAITDVPGVRVGHATVVRGEDVRTGVTVVMPHGGDPFQQRVPAAIHVFNGFGKLAGLSQVEELGELETPIALTNTLAVGTVMDALVGWTLTQPGNESVRSVNAVVGETNDGWLNDIRARHVAREDLEAAIGAARGGPVEEGTVGAGAGTVAFGWKGGIGTASRVADGFTVGVLVQSNFGGALTIDGARVPDRPRPGDERGSCMIVVATDAPLCSRNLGRLAARAVAGMARTGASFSNGSGDYVIAFSTAEEVRIDPDVPRVSTVLGNAALSPLFVAVADATEEAIVNSLLRATTVIGRDGHVAEAIPIDLVTDALRAR